jgi:hypothetical protein
VTVVALESFVWVVDADLTVVAVDVRARFKIREVFLTGMKIWSWVWVGRGAKKGDGEVGEVGVLKSRVEDMGIGFEIWSGLVRSRGLGWSVEEEEKRRDAGGCW